MTRRMMILCVCLAIVCSALSALVCRSAVAAPPADVEVGGNLKVGSLIFPDDSVQVSAVPHPITLIFNANSLTSSHGFDRPNTIFLNMFGSNTNVAFSLWELHSMASPEYPEPLTLQFNIPSGINLANGYDIDLHVFAATNGYQATDAVGNVQARIRAVYRSHAGAFNSQSPSVDEAQLSPLVSVTRPANLFPGSVSSNHYLITIHMTGTNAAPQDFCLLVIDRTDALSSPLDTLYLSGVELRFPAL